MPPIGMNGGKPFQSKLESHFDFILEARRKRQTWEAIARLLAEQGITTTKQAIHAFMKRRLKRRYPLGMAPATELVRHPTSRSVISELPELTESPPSASEFASDVEAAKTLSIPFICRKEIEHFLNRVFVQCEDAASVLTPDTALIQNKVLRVKDRLTRLAIDEFNPLDIHE